MKGFAIGCGLALAILFSAIGYVMSIPEAGVAYSWPLWAGLASVIGLPAGYASLVQTPAPWQLGLIGFAVMLAVLVALALPFLSNPDLQTAHGGRMIVWGVLWSVATFPFIRTASKR